MDKVVETIRAFDGVLELAPDRGSDYPEIAWGDHFFYYAPDGQVPQREQPFATIVTKDYPGDTSSRLDPPGRWRLNIHVGRATLAGLVGEALTGTGAPTDPGEADVVLPHPVYAGQGWVAVVNPAIRTMPVAISLLRDAHAGARRRSDRARRR